MIDGIYTENSVKRNSVSEELHNKIKRNAVIINSEEKNPIDRERRMFGDTFEIVATEENRKKHPETEVQRGVRSLIENLYQNAELVIGTNHERPSKPDGISVNFDGKGKLVIEEVVEFKSSNNAFLHGIEKGQPAKTLETLGAIVTILNRLKRGDETTKILPKDSDLSVNDRIKRDVELKKIKQQVIQLTGSATAITFSPEMVYRIVVPKGEELPDFDPLLLQDYGYGVELKVSQSDYSKRDIHEIIEESQKK